MDALKTRVKVTATGKNGKSEVILLDEDKYNELSQRVEDETDEDYVELGAPQVQTFVIYTVGETDPLADLAALIPSPSVMADIINRGLVTKQQMHYNKLMKQDGWTPSEENIDLAGVVAAESARHASSPEAKLAAMMSKLAGRVVSVEEAMERVQQLRGTQASA